jgi:hypothetical protein
MIHATLPLIRLNGINRTARFGGLFCGGTMQRGEPDLEALRQAARVTFYLRLASAREIPRRQRMQTARLRQLSL